MQQQEPSTPSTLKTLARRLVQLLRDRRLLLATAILALLGAFAGGASAGWWASERFSARSAPPLTMAPGDALGSGAGGPVMADVRGLSEGEAKQVLVDLGLGVVEVAVREQPSIGRPGSVMVQEPPAGQPATAKVTLVLAAPAVIPKLSGTLVAKATRDLEQLGAHVVVQRVYRPGAAVDTVLSVTPAEGQPAATNVVLVVAAPPAAVNLADLRPVKGSCSRDDVNVNGFPYRHSLRCNAGAAPSEVDYLLNRRTVRLEAVLGQADSGPPGQVVRYELLGDGKVLASAELKYGESKQIQADTNGVLRLTLRVRLAAPPPAGQAGADAVFGDIRVIGGPADVVALTEPVR